MENDFRNAVGKSVGEVMRDIADFLSLPCVLYADKQIDLAQLSPDLNMGEQFSFALLSEAKEQGVPREEAEQFYRQAVQLVLPHAVVDTVISAFRDPKGDTYRVLKNKYGNRFTLLDGSYWSTCLAFGIDAGQVNDVMRYLRMFTVCLMEYAYMGSRNPQSTYTWKYYESFRSIFDQLTAPPEPDPLPLKIRALGGTAGKREGESYPLSLGIDIENPNPDRMAYDVELDITLKDRNGDVIATVNDRIRSIDPATVYHYGVTRRIRGAATAGIAATARARNHLKLSTPIMKHVKMLTCRMGKQETSMRLRGELHSAYDAPLSALTLHYQFLSTDNKILGGAGEWLSDGIKANASREFATEIPLVVSGAQKVVYSVDFDALELID